MTDMLHAARLIATIFVDDGSLLHPKMPGGGTVPNSSERCIFRFPTHQTSIERLVNQKRLQTYKQRSDSRIVEQDSIVPLDDEEYLTTLRYCNLR